MTSKHAQNAKLSHDHMYRATQCVPKGGELVSVEYEGKDHKRKMIVIYNYNGQTCRTRIAAKTTSRRIYV